MNAPDDIDADLWRAQVKYYDGFVDAMAQCILGKPSGWFLDKADMFAHYPGWTDRQRFAAEVLYDIKDLNEGGAL